MIMSVATDTVAPDGAWQKRTCCAINLDFLLANLKSLRTGSARTKLYARNKQTKMLKTRQSAINTAFAFVAIIDEHTRPQSNDMTFVSLATECF